MQARLNALLVTTLVLVHLSCVSAIRGFISVDNNNHWLGLCSKDVDDTSIVNAMQYTCVWTIFQTDGSADGHNCSLTENNAEIPKLCDKYKGLCTGAGGTWDPKTACSKA